MELISLDTCGPRIIHLNTPYNLLIYENIIFCLLYYTKIIVAAIPDLADILSAYSFSFVFGLRRVYCRILSDQQ